MFEFLTSVDLVEAANVANYAIRLLEWRSSLSYDSNSLIQVNQLSVNEQGLADRVFDEIKQVEEMHFADLSDSASDRYVFELSRIVTSLVTESLSHSDLKRGNLILAHWEEGRGQVETDATLRVAVSIAEAEKRGQDRNLSRQGIKKARRYRRFWARMCMEFYPMMISYAEKLGADRASAEDLVQSVVTRVFRYLPNPTSIKNRKFFLIRQVRNAWLASRKATVDQSIESLEETADSLKSPEPDIQLNLEKEEILARVLAELEPLDPNLRRTIDMQLAGFNFREIAENLNESVELTRFRWQRFRNQISRRIKKRG
jgi:RNA polymerase sigma factor (sigma-70 family)